MADAPSNKVNANAIALRSALRLSKLLFDDGQFIYLHDHDTKRLRPGYNVLRHSGCIWALNTVHGTSEAVDRAIATASRRGMSWLVRSRIRSSQKGGFCIAEDGEVKLGANALAVLALTSMPDFSREDASLVEGLCEHMLAERTDEKGFIHKRIEQTWESAAFQSDYYDGEALFALLTAGRKLGVERYITAAAYIIEAFIKRGQGIAQQSHWMMYAVETCAETHLTEAMQTYADALAGNILANDHYRVRRECTPMACRTEALLAYLRFSERSGFTSSVAKEDVLVAVRENLTLQFNDYLPDGAFRKGFGSTRVRIDYLQHNLMAFLYYAQWQARAASLSKDRLFTNVDG